MELDIYDSFESSIPDIGLALFWDTENQKYQWVDTSSDLVIKKLKKHFYKNHSYFNNSFMKSGSSFVNIATNESYIVKLLELFKNK